MEHLSHKQRASYFHSLGLPREKGVPREDKTPDPRKGGSRGYPPWYKKRLISMWENGEAVPKCLDVSRSSKYRWKNRGDAYEMTGNKNIKGMPGHHRFLLAIFKKVYPHSTADECAVYIALFSDDNRVFTGTQMSRALADMEMTRKRASTTAYQAFTPRNLKVHHMFWNNTFPSGIIDT